MSPAKTTEAKPTPKERPDTRHFREAKLAVRAYARDPSIANEERVRAAWERVREIEDLHWQRFRHGA